MKCSAKVHSTLLAETLEPEGIIGRFSEFSKMPQPQLHSVQMNEVRDGGRAALPGAIAGTGT